MRHQRRGASRKIERRLRRTSTDGEALAWRVLRDRRRDAKFRRQHRIRAFVLDFYCPELRLGIEIDGAPHLTDVVRRYDEKRTRALESLGIRIARFSNNWAIANPGIFSARVEALIAERREELSKERSVIIHVRR